MIMYFFLRKSQVKEMVITLTKRGLKSYLQLCFDPLGFCLHYIVRAKILIQVIWISCLNWDCTLPEEMTTKILELLGAVM